MRHKFPTTIEAFGETFARTGTTGVTRGTWVRAKEYAAPSGETLWYTERGRMVAVNNDGRGNPIVVSR